MHALPVEVAVSYVETSPIRVPYRHKLGKPPVPAPSDTSGNRGILTILPDAEGAQALEPARLLDCPASFSRVREHNARTPFADHSDLLYQIPDYGLWHSSLCPKRRLF